MARKVPGVYQRGEKWYADAVDPTQRDSKGAAKKVRVRNPRTGRTSFLTQEDAIDAKEAFERGKMQARERTWTVREWAEEWTTNLGYTGSRSESTNRHNKERIKLFVDQHGDRPLEGIDRPFARKWAAENPARAAAVRAMFGDAAGDGIIKVNPFSNLKLKKGRGRKDLKPLTPSEVKLLTQICREEHPDWPVPAAMVEVAAYGGLRIGELLGLKWRDIDWENHELRVERAFNAKTNRMESTKNKEHRTIALLKPAYDALNELERVKKNDDVVFWTPRDFGQMSQQNFAYHWKPVRVAFKRDLMRMDAERAAVVGNVTFHELRHFCGSLLADMGATAQDIAEHLGHQDGGRLAQELYIHTYEDRSRARIKSIFAAASEDRERVAI